MSHTMSPTHSHTTYYYNTVFYYHLLYGVPMVLSAVLGRPLPVARFATFGHRATHSRERKCSDSTACSSAGHVHMQQTPAARRPPSSTREGYR